MVALLTLQFGTLVALVLPPGVPHTATAVLLIGQPGERVTAALQGQRHTPEGSITTGFLAEEIQSLLLEPL